MSLALRIILIVMAILSFVYFIRKIRKSQMKIEDAIYWTVFSIMIIVLSIVPELVIFVADAIGVESPVNFLFLAIIFLILLKLFSMSIKISQLENKVSVLTEEIAIKNKQLEEAINKRKSNE